MISSVGMSQQPLALLLNSKAAGTVANAPANTAGVAAAGPTANSEESGSGSPSTLFSPAVFDQLLAYQSQQTSGPASGAASASATSSGSLSGASTSADAAVQALMNLGAKEAATGQVDLDAPYKSTLFQIASGGSGTLTQGELETNVVAGGGTTQEADALYAQIDPSGAGTVSETQMAGQLATPVSGSGSFGNALKLYLDGGETGTDLQNDLIQKLMNVGLNNTQADAVAQQLQTMG
jgi:hypothetical protein